MPHKLLSDSIYLNDFINKRLPEVIIKQTKLEDFRIVEHVKIDSLKPLYYTTTGKNKLTANQLNNLADTLKKIKKQNLLIY